jgi:hypothetical protein
MRRDRSAEYDAKNRMCAEIILTRPLFYGLGMVTWARLVLGRTAQPLRVVLPEPIQVHQPEQMALFEMGEQVEAA